MVIVPLLVAGGRAWLSGLPGIYREILAYGVSLLIASLLAKTTLERVRFHRTEGPLARFAQRPAEWIGYTLPLLVSGMAVGFIAMAAIGVLQWVAALGGLVGGLLTGFALPFVRERIGRWWRQVVPGKGGLFHHHPHALMIGAAISAAAGIVCAQMPDDRNIDALSTGAFALVVIVLTGRVDAGVVRYMTLVGHSTGSLLRNWVSMQFALLVPTTAILMMAQDWIAASVGALSVIGLTVMTVLQVLAYRAFSRLIAQWMVAIVILAAGLVGLAFPPLGAIVVVSAMFWLLRKGLGSRWLLT